MNPSYTGNTPNTPNTSLGMANTAKDAVSNASTKVTDSVTENAQAVQHRVDDMLTQAPAAINHVVKEAEALSQSAIERVRLASVQARAQIDRASDRTVGYIKDEPVKSVLIAAAVGALSAALIGWAARSRSSR